MRKILLISPEAWGNNKVSKHHYALELSTRGDEVYFLNPNSDSSKSIKINKNLTIVDYKERLRGLAYLPRFIQRLYFKYALNRLEKSLGCQFDVIWNFDSSRFYELSLVKEKIKICHIVDMAENIQRPLLAQTSDICFCTSDFIKKELMPYNNQVEKIDHGYQLPKENYELSDKFDSGKIQIGYVGNLTRTCIDWEIIQRLVQEHAELQFTFIGNYDQSNLSAVAIDNGILNVLRRGANVSLLGSKESHLIPSYLQQFDVLLSVYKIENESDIKQHSNLHKTMEYLGSGKVTVSTYSDEYKDKRELLEMVDESKEFFTRFDEVVKNLSYYNSEEKQAERRAFVAEHTYAKQLERVDKILERLKS